MRNKTKHITTYELCLLVLMSKLHRTMQILEFHSGDGKRQFTGNLKTVPSLFILETKNLIKSLGKIK